MLIDRDFCGCVFTVDGLAVELCGEHARRSRLNQYTSDDMLDRELDACIREMFGDRRIERTPGVIGNFAIKR